MGIVALANLKGGVGKSTLSVNISGALLSEGKSVTLVDADPQGTATSWADAGNLPFEVLPLPLGNLTRWIETVTALPGDVVIDLPPMLGEATGAALAVCDMACIPVTPSGADLKATARAIEMVQEARTARQSANPRILLVPSKVDRRTAAGGEIEAVLHDYGEPVGPVVSQRIAHVDAFTSGQWIGDYAPGSAGHTEIKVLASVIKRAIR